MKVIFEYDPSTGNLTDRDGCVYTVGMNMNHFGDPAEQGTTVRDLIKLKEAGFSAEEIVQMKDGGVL